MKKYYAFILFLIFSNIVSAQENEKDKLDERFKIEKEVLKKERSTYIQDAPFDELIPVQPNQQFQVLVLSYTQGVVQNFSAQNEFLKGQIVGRLFGDNTTRTSNKPASYFEQRAVPFFIYSPKLFNGKATFRASFKIDVTWGDNAYGTGGHGGGGLSTSQVNLETQNIEFEYRFAKTWSVNAGLLRLYDTPHDLYRTTFTKFVNTGYRLNYWATNAAGIVINNNTDWYKLKGGFYQLYENNVEFLDDVMLFEVSSQFSLSKNWNLGGSVYYLNDRSNGKGGVSILGQGPRSLLAGYNGAYKFQLGGDPIKTDVAWVGTFFSRNEDMMNDRFFMSGFVNSNLGAIRQDKDDGKGYQSVVDIMGVAANLRGGYRYGQTTNDAITLDVLYSSGNHNGIADGKYTGVITGNTWGSPIGLMI